MDSIVLDYKKYAAISRQATAEGIVLLENENQTLPLETGSKIALLGRMQFDTYFTGTGSGGLVHNPYVVNIHEALNEIYDLEPISQQLYKVWLNEHPFDKGEGWAKEPWAQVEMKLDNKQLDLIAEYTDTAVVVISRTAGEDKDHNDKAGSYYLNKDELDLLHKAREKFSKLVVLLNVGNIMDLSWNVDIKVDSLLLVWQGGSETGNAIADILSGKVSPSGHLTDTVAYSLKDYPAYNNFGDKDRNFYAEDIYVGYRYFETFNKAAVQYPFGYGLSYSNFEFELNSAEYANNNLNIKVKVKNTGNFPAKAVPQIYLAAPQGELGKAEKVLLDFAKTKTLIPGESEEINFNINNYEMASFDDSGKTGHKNAYVLEAGQYRIYLGEDVRHSEEVFAFDLEKLEVVEQLEEVLAPVHNFSRLKPGEFEEDNFSIAYEDVPTKTISEKYFAEKEDDKLAVEFESSANLSEYQSKNKYDFSQYVNDEIDVDTYLSQFPTEDFIKLSRGIGMSPAGVTAGVAGAFGGAAKVFADSGMPLVACADGPSGIRMDDGSMAFQVAIGTALASSFNTELNRELYEYLGLEIRKNKIDSLLGPGMNIHRHPLCGRNFEYFSEDPIVTGKIGLAQVEGLKKWNVAGTVKHFALNNQEFRRNFVDAIVSARAAREIYLKGFEYVVRSGELLSIMTSYNPVNGIFAASNFELNTQILRNEWGFDGVVMTDWWAKMNWGVKNRPSRRNLGAMIYSQNDINMPNPSADINVYRDKGLADLQKGRINRKLLIRNARNICKVVKEIYHGYNELDLEILNEPKIRRSIEGRIELGLVERIAYADTRKIEAEKNSMTYVAFESRKPSDYIFRMTAKSNLSNVAQANIAITINQSIKSALTLKGNETKDIELRFNTASYNNYVEIFYAEGGLDIIELSVERVNSGDDSDDNDEKNEVIADGVNTENEENNTHLADSENSKKSTSGSKTNIEENHLGVFDKDGLEKLLLQAYVQKHREVRFNKISYARHKFFYLLSIFLIVTSLLFFPLFAELLWAKCRG